MTLVPERCPLAISKSKLMQLLHETRSTDKNGHLHFLSKNNNKKFAVTNLATKHQKKSKNNRKKARCTINSILSLNTEKYRGCGNTKQHETHKHYRHSQAKQTHQRNLHQRKNFCQPELLTFLKQKI